MIAPDLLFAATIRTAVPLLLAAGGELISERAGIINVGLEGAVISGAFAATVGALHLGIRGGYAAGALAGVCVGLLMTLFVVTIRADQILAGTAVTMLSFGLTGALYRAIYGATGVALTVPTSPSVFIPVLSSLPVVGSALFAQPLVFYFAYALIPALSLALYRTHAGLGVRASGEDPNAARAAGIPVARLRSIALVAGSSLGGLAGAVLVLAQAGTFAEGMSAGRGFIAIAVVALGRWTPWGVLAAAVVFGLATAVQYVVQVLGWPIPYELVLMLPYVLTLLALVLSPRGAAPAMLARADA